MACRRVILREAAREYEAIVAYLAKQLGSPQAARNFMEEFDHQLDIISENPEINPLSRMPELAAHGYRAGFANSYVMIYRASEGIVYIAHIFHQSQDYAQLV